MTFPRPVNPLVRTTIDIRVDRADRTIDSRLFGGWGFDLVSRIY